MWLIQTGVYIKLQHVRSSKRISDKWLGGDKDVSQATITFYQNYFRQRNEIMLQFLKSIVLKLHTKFHENQTETLRR